MIKMPAFIYNSSAESGRFKKMGRRNIMLRQLDFSIFTFLASPQANTTI